MGGALYDLDYSITHLWERILQLTPYPTVGEHATQPREALYDIGQLWLRAVGILDIGLVDCAVDQISLGIWRDIAFPNIDLPAAVVAEWRRFLCFQALAVDYAGNW